MPKKRRRPDRTQGACSAKVVGLAGTATMLGGAAIVRTALPRTRDRMLARVAEAPIIFPATSEPYHADEQASVATDVVERPAQRQLPVWLRTLAWPAAIMQLIWMAIFALTALVWLQFIPSAVSDGIVRWPIPREWFKHSQNNGQVAHPIYVPPPSMLGIVLLTALLFAAVGTFVWALIRARALQEGDNRVFWFILAVAAIMGLTLVFLPVLPSGDVISYISYGRIDVLYHGNALIDVPGKFPQDPFLAYNYWDDLAAYYGPVWLLVSNGLTMLAQVLGGSVVVSILLFKLFTFAGFLTCAALIWDILSHIAPQRRVVGTLLWAWNPLTVWEFNAGGHNDPLMLALFLGGIALLVRGREVPGLLLWGMAVAAKYTLIVLVPLYLWYLLLHGWSHDKTADARPPLWRALSGEARPNVVDRAAIVRRLWGICWRGALVVGVVIVCLLPFWRGSATFTTLLNSPSVQRTTNSLQDSLRNPMQAFLTFILHMRPSAAATLAVPILKVLGLASFVILWGWQLWRNAARDLAKAAGWVMLGLLLFTISWFYPWYTSWLLMVVALRPMDRLTKAGLILAASVLLVDLLGELDGRGAIIWLPMLSYLGWTWWQERRRKATMGDMGPTVTDEVEVRHST
jgi:hypothetical protein